MHRLTLKIHGNVQGVTFRWEARDLARKLKLNGWVKNMLDGTVELVAEGKEEQLKKLLEYCKIGPQGASVSRLNEKWESIEATQFKDFQIEF